MSSEAARPRRRTPLIVAIAAVAIAALVVGVLLWRDRFGDGADDVEALAGALASGDFTGVGLDGMTAEEGNSERERVLGDLIEATGQAPVVAVDDAGTADDGSRAATLHWTWTLTGGSASADGTAASDAGGTEGADDASDAGGTEGDGSTGAAEEPETWDYTTEVTFVRGDDGWDAQLAPTAFAPDLAASEHLELTTLAATVGSVVDSDGNEVFGERAVRILGLDKIQIEADDQEQAARDLADLLGIDADNYAAKVAGYGAEAFVPALTIREEAAGDYPLDQAAEITGYRALEDTLPLAASRTYAPGVLGTLSTATAEDVEGSDGAIQEGDLVASGGVVAARYDELVGADGLDVRAVDDEAGTERSLHRVEPTDGTEVAITLDSDIQELATAAIADEDSASAVIVLQPSTGDVLATALGPTGQSYPVGLVGQYAPGSTFKAVTALALLRAGLTPESSVQCPETATVEGRSFKNADSLSSSLFGEMTLAEAIAHSCNTAMVLQSDTVDQQSLADAATALGLGQDAPDGLDAFMGSVDPDDEGTEHAAAMIGQGRVLASPLAMAVVLASIQQGQTVQPRILADDTASESADSADSSGSDGAAASDGAASDDTSSDSADSSGSSDGAASLDVSDPLTEDEAAQMQELLRGVVTDGSLDDFADLPGDPVIGKTGTAEWTDANGDIALHSWVMVAQGDLVVVAFVEDGSYGSVTAGPIARDVLEGIAAL
ncbi:penicillin-binding transpeptidase domain-containing protein [Brachybacterium sp. DNPG3]